MKQSDCFMLCCALRARRLMRNRHVLTYPAIFLVLISTISGLLHPCHSADNRKKVLILHSYHQGFLWTDGIMKGMLSVLTESGAEIEPYVEYMDTKRFPPPASFVHFKNLFIQKYRQAAFDVVLLSDNNTFDFVLSERQTLFHDTPVVFCGINNFHDGMIKDQTGITGISEKIDIKGTITLALRIKPEIRTFYVVNDDTATGRINLEKFRSTVTDLRDQSISFQFLDNFTAMELQHHIRQLPPDSGVLLFTFHRDRVGRWFSIKEYLRLIQKNCKVPVFSFWEHYMGYGVMGGVMVSGEQQGKKCAQSALRILKGESASTIPVIKQSPNLKLLDYRMLRRFNVSQSQIPEDTVILFEPESVFRKHRSFFIVFAISFAILFTLVIALSVNMLRRKRMEDTLRESEEKFNRAFHSCPVLMSISTLDQGIFLDVNHQFLKKTGLSREEVIGRKSTELRLWDKNSREDIILEIKQKGFVYNKDVEVITKSGEAINIIWFGDVVNIGKKPCLIVTGYDITDLKRAEKELKKSEEQFRRQFESSPIPTFIWELENQGLSLTNYNQAVDKLTHGTAKKFMGMSVEDIYPDRPDIIDCFYTCLRQKQTIIYETDYLSRGTKLDRKIIFTFASVSSHLILLHIEDITARKAAEAKLREYSERLEEMVRERTQELEKAQNDLLVRERLALLGHFSGSIAHELRNPLAVIDSSAYLLNIRLGDGDEKTSQVLRRITANVRKSTAIIQSLLDLSQMKKPAARSHDIAQLIRGALDSSHIPDPVSVELDCPEDRFFVYADFEQFRMALKNIIKNAVEAMKGGGKLTISVRTKDAETLEIAVADTGAGIAPEDLPKVFEPLFTRKVHGIGFGLSITKMIIENHEGTVMVESQPGKGSIFMITLPRLR